MTIDFLLKHTSAKNIEANTVLKGIWYGALYYLIEFFVRRWHSRKFVNRIVDDLVNHEELKSTFIDLLKLSVSEDGTFLFIPFDDVIPQEVKEQSEPEQLSTLVESYFIEYTQQINNNPLLVSTFMMNNLFSTLVYIPNANVPFILLESKHLAYIMAIKNHWLEVILFASLQILLISIITILTLTFI